MFQILRFISTILWKFWITILYIFQYLLLSTKRAKPSLYYYTPFILSRNKSPIILRLIHDHIYVSEDMSRIIFGLLFVNALVLINLWFYHFNETFTVSGKTYHRHRKLTQDDLDKLHDVKLFLQIASVIAILFAFIFWSHILPPFNYLEIATPERLDNMSAAPELQALIYKRMMTFCAGIFFVLFMIYVNISFSYDMGTGWGFSTKEDRFEL